MKTLLHIIASPRGEASFSQRVGNAVVEQFRRQHPDGKVDTLDLFAEELPRLTLNTVNNKYRLLSGKELDERWLPYVNREMRKVDEAQALIDAPEEYARLAEACNGEIKKLAR